MGRCITCLSASIAFIAILVYVIHNSAPFLSLQCVAFGIHCPISMVYGTIDDAYIGSDHLKPIKQIMQNWVRDGYSHGEQLSVFVRNKEILNIFAKDYRKYPQFDHTSIVPVFSNSKSFASLAIAIAVKNKWIKSYEDKVTDYWPEFPTKKITISLDRYIKYYDHYSSNKSQLTIKTFLEFNNESGVIDTEPHYVRIKDLLRHEGGLCLDLSKKEMQLTEITTDQLAKRYQDIGYLIYFKESTRCYHSFSRGHLLNAIFMRVEPKQRSISAYYMEEIEAKLKKNVASDKSNEYILRFDGLRNNSKWINKYYEIESQPLWWSLYHALMPFKLGFDKPFNDLFAKQLCSSYIDASLCPNASTIYTKRFMDVSSKILSRRIAGFNGLPKDLSSQFVKQMKSPHMSFSGVGNAYSLAKTMSYVLFSGDVFDEEMLDVFVAEPDTKLDIFAQANTEMSQGGIGLMDVQGVKWYGWNGWGGSMVYFAPRYHAVVAWTVTSFRSPHYYYLDAPRLKVIFTLVSEQLLSTDS